MSSIEERAQGYGRVGSYLLGLRETHPEAFAGYGASTFVADLVRLQSSLGELRRRHPLLPAAVSLLALPFPLQIDVSLSTILSIARTAAGVPFNYVLGTTDSKFVRSLPDFNPSRTVSSYVSKHMRRVAFLEKAFPVKEHAAAARKVNLALAPLVSSFIRAGRGALVRHLIILLAGRVFEDQFINTLLYGAGLAVHFGSLGWDIAAHYILEPGVAKSVSVALKALGANTSREGALLVEADTLQGRLAGPIDLEAEARYRCDPDAVARKVIDVGDDIRPHIRAILQHELRDRDLALPDLHSWWSARWLWCVNGSQTKVSSERLGVDPSSYRDTHNRVYRRMVSESVEQEPLTTWDGHTTVSASVKLENGKQRAIFACDTTSYFAFSWILGATERVWRNERVILNPGAGGHVGITRRIRNAQRGGGVNLMLDYDDFNSHHSTRTMQIVFEELCDMFGAPDWYRDVIVSSFEKMYLRVDGWSRVQGTLMSGHRGTTFINSVLNAAYLRAAIGGPQFDRMLSLHAGDDVYIRCNTLSDCETVLYSSKEFGCRMNPTKQSVGFVGAEFLRVAIGRKDAYGYYSRGVAGFTSGNWVSFDVLKPVEGLQNAITGMRTLINRSGCFELPKLVAPALRYTRGIGVKMLVSLLAGEMALTGGPVYNTDGWIRNVKVTVPTPPAPPVPSKWARNATRDYLTSHLSEIEMTAINMVGVDAMSLLVASSYSKGLNQNNVLPSPEPRFSRLPPRLARGYVAATDLLSDRAERGVLTGYPVLRLFDSRLSDEQLRTLVMLAGGDHTAPNIRDEAFGRSAESKNIMGYLSYGDAATLSGKTSSGNIYVLHQIYV